jgi:hypothetical protein
MHSEPNAIQRAVAHAALLEIERLVRSYEADVAEMVGYFADVDAAEQHDTERPPPPESPSFPGEFFAKEPDTFAPTSRTLNDADEVLQTPAPTGPMVGPSRDAATDDHFDLFNAMGVW